MATTDPLIAPLPDSARGHAVPPHHQERRLRTAMTADGGGSLVAGVLALVAAGWFAGRMEVSSWAVAGAGALFVIFGAEVLLATRRTGPGLATAARATGVVNAAYAVATVVVLFTGVLSTWGAVLVGALGLWALDMAVAQWWLARRVDGGR